MRKASLYCLAVWLGIWIVFMVMRFSPFDIRNIPGIGQLLLIALVVAVLAPLVATVLAGVAVFREPRERLNWLTAGCAGAVLVGQYFLFLVTRWM